MARTTRQRAAVRAVFADLDGFHSAQEVHARLREAGDPVGLSTVYRAVQSLADDGELDTIRTDSGEALYRRCSPQHHHHLVCRGCGLTVEVAGPAVEQWADRIAGDHGFADVSHTLEIFGTCAACRAAEPAQGGQMKSQTVPSGSTWTSSRKFSPLSSCRVNDATSVSDTSL